MAAPAAHLVHRGVVLAVAAEGASPAGGPFAERHPSSLVPQAVQPIKPWKTPWRHQRLKHLEEVIVQVEWSVPN